MSKILLLNPSITVRMTAMRLAVDPTHARALPLAHRQVLFAQALATAELVVNPHGRVYQCPLRVWIRKAHFAGLHLFMPDGAHFSTRLGRPDPRRGK